MFRKKEKKSIDTIRPLKRAPKWIRFWNSLSIVDFAGDCLESFFAWRLSRPWLQISLFLPCIIVLAAVSITYAIGKRKPQQQIRASYIALAEAELKSLSEEKSLETTLGKKESLSQEPPTRSDFLDILFKRVLQLESNNKLAQYYVATKLASFGKPFEARKIMQELAPRKRDGLDRAHEWLVHDLIEQGVRTGKQVDVDVLRHHLRNAVSRPDASNELLLLYAQLLLKEERVHEATAYLNRAAKIDPKVLLTSATVYMQRGMVGQATRAADSLISQFDKLQDADPTFDKSIAIADAYLVTNRVDQAIETLLKASRRPNPSSQLRMALSNAYRAKFYATLSSSPTQLNMNFDYLDQAILHDPANFAIRDDLLRLASQGLTSSPQAIATIRNQLITRGSSLTARLLLADSAIRQSDFPTAVSHYEVLLAQVPHMTFALNNVAMLQLRSEPPNPKRAMELIDQAIQISPDVAELYDSKGDIEASLGNRDNAIAMLIQAIQKDPRRMGSIGKLIPMLGEAGRTEEATAYETRLEQLRAAAEAATQPQSTATPEKTNVPPVEPTPVEPTPVEPMPTEPSSAVDSSTFNSESASLAPSAEEAPAKLPETP